MARPIVALRKGFDAVGTVTWYIGRKCSSLPPTFVYGMMEAMVFKITNSVHHALKGLCAAYKRDRSFRMEACGGALFVLVGYFLWPLRSSEFLFLALSFSLILIAELINTAFEQILERLHPERHELIGKGKDIASAAVLTAFIFAGIVVIVISLTHAGFFPA